MNKLKLALLVFAIGLSGCNIGYSPSINSSSSVLSSSQLSTDSSSSESSSDVIDNYIEVDIVSVNRGDNLPPFDIVIKIRIDESNPSLEILQYVATQVANEYYIEAFTEWESQIGYLTIEIFDGSSPTTNPPTWGFSVFSINPENQIGLYLDYHEYE